MEELLAALKTLFIKLFQPFLATFVASLHVTTSAKLSAPANLSAWNFQTALDGWDAVFDKLLRGLEDKAAQVRIRRPLASPFAECPLGKAHTCCSSYPRGGRCDSTGRRCEH